MNRARKPQVLKVTSRKKFKNSLKSFSEWCKKNRNMGMTELFHILNLKLRGYYNYYGVRGTEVIMTDWHPFTIIPLKYYLNG